MGRENGLSLQFNLTPEIEEVVLSEAKGHTKAIPPSLRDIVTKFFEDGNPFGKFIYILLGIVSFRILLSHRS